MKWKNRRFVLGALMSVGIVSFGILAIGGGSDAPVESDVVQPSETVPEYLAFVQPFEAGVSYSVAKPDDSDEIVESSSGNDSSETSTPVEVSGTIPAGVYVTPVGVKDCEFELWRTMEDGSEQMIGSDYLKEGRMIVSINEVEPDRFYSSEGCGEWSPWSNFTEELLYTSNGDYWTGDLKKGVWKVGAGCVWERVRDFRGTALVDSVETGLGPDRVAIGEESLGLRVRGCLQPLEFESSSVPDSLAFVEED